MVVIAEFYCNLDRVVKGGKLPAKNKIPIETYDPNTKMPHLYHRLYAYDCIVKKEILFAPNVQSRTVHFSCAKGEVTVHIQLV